MESVFKAISVEGVIGNRTISEQQLREVLSNPSILFQLLGEALGKSKEGSIRRASLFPVQDEEQFTRYKIHEARAWSADEMEFIRDKKDYDTASPVEKHIVDTILSFFLPGDGKVIENLLVRFLLECSNIEETSYFISQLRIEMVHAETYGMTGLTFLGEERLASLLIEAENSPYVRAKTELMDEYINGSGSKSERLLAFACSEGIFFCALFPGIFVFKAKGKFMNFAFSNELIMVDESDHRDNGCALHRKEGGIGQEKAVALVARFVEVEDMFAEYMLREPYEDLNIENMKQYIRLCADNLLVKSGYEPHWRATNPWPWMDEICNQRKENFYERRVGAYKRGSVAESLNWRKRTGLTKQNESAYQAPQEVSF